MTASGVDDLEKAVITNYAATVVACLIWPVAIYAVYRAKKNVLERDHWTASHWTWQIRTNAVFLIVGGVLGVAVIALFLLLPFGDRVQAVQSGAIVRSVSSLFYIVLFWAFVRALKGWHMASLRQRISHPRSFSIWPSAPIG